ncbi:hypothetical protein DRW41_12025 [Neobacillus piezotolerans]|uniref:Peptidase n=1 Tax=Neobacillus piezotolerans TaxID=2259171 RepID=A0A3D8GQK9_9BACI|nr:hypothetical protein [Neobacillus piezotolerans]RDU36773.1 hypothetical protein DRW41_12025 [Neobacillus piezotolerans]
MINKLSIVKLNPIIIREDRKNYIVEDRKNGEFYEMPNPAVDAINLINKGKPLGDIEQILKVKYPNEDIDIIDFANQLLDLELISEVNGELILKEVDQFGPTGFLWIPESVSRFFFNKYSYIFYISLLLFNIYILLTNHHLLPNYKDYFIFSWMSLNILLWLGIGGALLILHEFGHIIAMRANGLPTRLSIGHRLFFIALETDMAAAWKLPSGKRNVLYLGGLCFDMVAFACALSIQYFYPTGPALLLAIMKILVIDIFIRFIFQCGVYMKTDLYFVIENISGSYNLMENAHHYIKSKFKKEARKAGEAVYEEEKRTIKSYSVIYFIGVLLTILVFVFYSIPQIITTMSHSIDRLSSPLFSKPFFDGAIVLVQTLTGLSLLLYSWYKKYRLKKE